MHGMGIDYYRLAFQYLILGAIGFAAFHSARGKVDEKPLPRTFYIMLAVIAIVGTGATGVFFLVRYNAEEERLAKEAGERRKAAAEDQEREAKSALAEKALASLVELDSYTFDKPKLDCKGAMKFLSGELILKAVFSPKTRFDLYANSYPSLSVKFLDKDGFEVASLSTSTRGGTWDIEPNGWAIQGRTFITSDEYRRITKWSPEFVPGSQN